MSRNLTKLNRRKAIARAASLPATLAVPASIIGLHSSICSADEDANPAVMDIVRVGVIGTGNRACQLMNQLPKTARIEAICDCRQARIDETLKQFDAKWRTYADHRSMFEHEQLDGVIIATPDHGRSLPCIEACQAGIDVYAEKPLTAYISEGREVVRAARRYNRIFQVGTQQRTMEINDHCCRLVREGKLGRINHVSAVAYTGPVRYEGLPEQTIPAGNDWDRWCGPTPKRPFNHQLQSGWMKWRAYSGGEMTNWGAHGVDQIQWALGNSLTGPTEFEPISPGPNGKVVARYEDGTEVRFELDSGPMGGAVFHCEQGKLEINRNKFSSNPKDLIKDAPDPAVQEKWEQPGWIAGPHLANWLDCIKTRSTPNADVEIGHRTISFCHLVNITRELGRKVRWNPDAERFIDDPEADRLITRSRREGYELPSIE